MPSTFPGCSCPRPRSVSPPCVRKASSGGGGGGESGSAFLFVCALAGLQAVGFEASHPLRCCWLRCCRRGQRRADESDDHHVPCLKALQQVGYLVRFDLSASFSVCFGTMESVEKECGALGGLFQAIVNDMKVTQIKVDKASI